MSERRITTEEIEVVSWLLANASMKDVSEYRVEHLADAHVVSSCRCGCASIDFVFNEGGAGVATGTAGLRSTAILAEAFAQWPDGARAGVMLWAAEGKLLGIELYDLGSDASRRFPTVEVLRRWEDCFEVHPGG
jgi:hypothetical protein